LRAAATAKPLVKVPDDPRNRSAFGLAGSASSLGDLSAGWRGAMTIRPPAEATAENTRRAVDILGRIHDALVNPGQREGLAGGLATAADQLPVLNELAGLFRLFRD